MNAALNLRNGTSSDEDWLFKLFRATMQNYIDKAWGWDELLQREGFTTSLPAKYFYILEANDKTIASYYLSDKTSYFFLDMILVEPSRQRQGHGTKMMNKIKQGCSEQNKPVELSVLKTNPAVEFHLASGFEKLREDEHSMRMRWVPPEKH